MKTKIFFKAHKEKILTVSLLALISVMFFNLSITSDPKEVPFPHGYRNWKHIKSAIIGPESPAYERFGGFHHIYANEKALEGYRTGKFPDGSVLVFDVLEIVNEKTGDIVEGPRRFVDVMVRDRLKYDSTGGWGFEEFNKGNPAERNILTLANKECFTCHKRKKENDFVFSTMRE